MNDEKQSPGSNERLKLEGRVELLDYLLHVCERCQHSEPWRSLFAEIRARAVEKLER